MSEASVSLSFTQCQYDPSDDDEVEWVEEQYAVSEELLETTLQRNIRRSFQICPHCDLWLCLPHCLQHQQLLQSKANVLNDEANQIRQALSALSVAHVYDRCKETIDDWRERMYAEINAHHTRMQHRLESVYQEVHDEVECLKAEKIPAFVNEIATPLAYMLTKQKQVHPARLDFLEAKINTSKEEIERICNYDFIQTNCDEIQLKGDASFSRKPFRHKSDEHLNRNQTLDLAKTRSTPEHQFSLKSQSYVMGVSPRFILVIESPSTLVLFNSRHELDRIVTADDRVYDICWCETMKMFLIVGGQFHTYDVLTNVLQSQPSLDWDESETHIKSITCYRNTMFLSWGRAGSITSYYLPSFSAAKTWLSDEYLQKGTDSGVGCMRFNDNGILAMSILQRDLLWRVDLFDREMNRIRRGLTFAEEGKEQVFPCFLFPMIDNEWLLMNHACTPETLSILDTEGKVKQHVQRTAQNVALLGTERLVLRDINGINLYRIWSDTFSIERHHRSSSFLLIHVYSLYIEQCIQSFQSRPA